MWQLIKPRINISLLLQAVHKRLLLEPVVIATFIATLASFLGFISIFVFLVIESLPFVSSGDQYGALSVLWFPPEDSYGLISMIYGTLIVTIIALLFASPFSLLSAVFVGELLSPRLRGYAKTSMELLAGVPSIIYGLLGIEVVSRLVKQTFGLSDGSTILTAGIVLAIMILPTVMTVSEDAIKRVPQSHKDAAQGLGLTQLEKIVHVIFPMALPGIVSANLLGIGRALGETMAVMLIIGSVDRLPEPLFNILQPATTITTKLGREAAESIGFGIHWNAMVALALILLVMVISVSAAAFIIQKRRFA